MEFDTTKFIEVLKAASLSAREAEVAVGVAHGDEDKEIAVKLGLSLSAVRKYEERAREKLGAENRVDLAAAAVRLYDLGGGLNR